MSSKQLDVKAILMFASVAAIAYFLFNSYNQKDEKLSKQTINHQWGPMAGSGPGIAPEIVEAECPRHKQRPANIDEVSPFNPSASGFASV